MCVRRIGEVALAHKLLHVLLKAEREVKVCVSGFLLQCVLAPLGCSSSAASLPRKRLWPLCRGSMVWAT